MAWLRILSYNLLSLAADRRALIRVVRHLKPDLLVGQEAPRRVRWRSRTAAFARECGMLFIGGGRTAGGNIVLAAPRVSTTGVVERRIPRPWGDPIRGVVAVTAGIGRTTLGLVGVHLGIRQRDRDSEVPHAVEAIERFGDLPVILAGDLNEPPDGQSWKTLADAGLEDPSAEGSATPTFPATSPRVRIDAILTTEGLDVREYGVPDEPAIAIDLRRATDHLPVLAVVDVP